MDFSVSGQSKLSRWFAKSSVRALIVAGIVLAILAVLHVNQLRSDAPMKELLQGYKLQNRELQKLQLAFGQAGLSDFKIQGGSVFVPQESHSAYLAAAVENGAVPNELQTASTVDTELANPFLSRAQQESIEHKRRNQQICEMVRRLPFVDQAWFEMDQLKRRNAFDSSDRSAVVSIRPIQGCCMSDNQVATVKQMIANAVVDLADDRILVVDLEEGAAMQAVTDELTAKERQIHEIASNQKRFYERRLQELLSEFDGVEIRVDVDVQERVSKKPSQVVAIPEVVRSPQVKAPLISAGANGVASIEPEITDVISVVQSPVQEQVAQTNFENRVDLRKQLKVLIQVPSSTVFQKVGEPDLANEVGSQAAFESQLAEQTQMKFEQVKSLIVERVLPVFPKNALGGESLAAAGHSLTVELANTPSLAANLPLTTTEKVQRFLERNWPSVAVLGIGLVLLTIVTRRPVAAAESDGVLQGTEVVDLAASVANDDAEVRLTQLIEEDPDSAAKIIETWIRDAA